MISNYDKKLGITINQISLGLTTNIRTLGIRCNDGYHPVEDVGDTYPWLFGNNEAITFGDLVEIYYGHTSY